MSKEGFSRGIQKSTHLMSKGNKPNLSKYVSGKIKYVSKERKRDIGLVMTDQVKSQTKSRNNIGIPKYKTNEYHKTALGRYNKDYISSDHKSKPPRGSIKRIDTSLGGDYSKISDSMTFDYSIESQSSKVRLNKVAQAMLGNFDPLCANHMKKGANKIPSKVGISTSYAKNRLITPKSQSPHNEVHKPRKISKK